MAEHSELVKEMAELEKLTSQERLKLAKKRRQTQLKKHAEYEKKHDKQEKQAHKRKTKAVSMLSPPTSNNHQNKGKTNSLPQSTQKPPKSLRCVQFDSGVKLLEAAARNDVTEVGNLLEQGVSPDVANEDGLTALHQCCIDDSEQMLLLLLKHGANVNSRDSELWTPLHAASTCGHLRICQHLLRKDADLLAVNADGNMPYDICEDEATLEFIETEMASQGVTQDLIDETRLSTEKKMLADIKEFEREGYSVSAWLDRTGSTLLHIAAANGYYDVTSYLLTKRLDVNSVDNDGWTAAMAAACWGQIPVLELLAKNGADLETKTKDNKSIIDLVDDTEIKDQITEIKQEIKVNLERFKRDNSDVRRRSSTNIRSSHLGNSSIYNSNTSLSDKNPFSSSVRRHSMREKHKLSMKEARDEAQYRISINTEDTPPIDSVTDSTVKDTPITNIDDIDMMVSDNNVTTINITSESSLVEGDNTMAEGDNSMAEGDNSYVVHRESTNTEQRVTNRISATITICDEEADAAEVTDLSDNDKQEDGSHVTNANVQMNNGDRNSNMASIQVDSLDVKNSSDVTDIKQTSEDPPPANQMRGESLPHGSRSNNKNNEEPALKRFTQPSLDPDTNISAKKGGCCVLS